MPNRLLDELREAAVSVSVQRLALMGGVVRDQLLHQCLRDLWRFDLDLVVEGMQQRSPQSWLDVAAQTA